MEKKRGSYRLRQAIATQRTFFHILLVHLPFLIVKQAQLQLMIDTIEIGFGRMCAGELANNVA
jgi:hypothetical protein